jgi:hypothetical protein
VIGEGTADEWALENLVKRVFKPKKITAASRLLSVQSVLM